MLSVHLQNSCFVIGTELLSFNCQNNTNIFFLLPFVYRINGGPESIVTSGGHNSSNGHVRP